MSNIYIVTINGFFDTIIECSCEEIAVETAMDYFRLIDHEDIKEIKIEKL